MDIKRAEPIREQGAGARDKVTVRNRKPVRKSVMQLENTEHMQAATLTRLHACASFTRVHFLYFCHPRSE